MVSLFISRDGTPIACRCSGTGPPLVLVHGMAGASTRWAPILPGLEEYFTVYAMDRRGRGESGDGDGYAMEREFEDVAAVVDGIGEPVNLLGHSSGGLFSLEAALLTQNIRKLVLYEPLEVGATLPEGGVDRLQALLDAGDREEVLTTFMREFVNIPPQEIELIKSTPAWPARMAAAHTLPRELRAEERYEFDAQRFEGLHVPTLLLTGGDSPQFFKGGVEVVDAALPNSWIVVLPGQRHNADQTAPDLFVREVLAFLTEG
ncbi:MAG: alpha/beta hydrolase [Dehalococcoidia bacterium]